MTPKEKIGRLEDLLARVQRRATEPRAATAAQVSPKATTGAMAAAPALPANGGAPAMSKHATQESMNAVARQPSPEPAQAQSATPATPRVSEPPAFPTSPPDSAPAEDTFPSEPPLPSSSAIPPMATLDAGSDGEVDVEVSTEVVDIDVDVDVDDMGMPLESGAQPVADHASFGDDQGIGDTTMADAELPVLGPENEVHSDHQPGVAKALANEIEEPAPSSSPRPIASEKPEAFEEESAPRHTPPPESGKQVAAPSTPPSRKTSAPPPSLEGHTLIGGWREPGLGGPIIGAPAGAGHGVRVPAPPQQHPGSPPAPAAAIGAAMPPEPVTGTRANAPPRHSDRPLSPDVTRADLGAAGGAKVASFEGAAPAFKPSTFGELLDASLGL